MDRYPFPHITHISQCLEAIRGCDAFYVEERDRHTIINYYQMGNDTFPPVTVHREWTKMIKPDPALYEKRANHQYYSRIGDYDINAALRRECRGIVFGPDGTVIARRLHKFFNYGEREENLEVDMTEQHVILEKLDGSMITPIPIGDYIRWGTKMGLTEVGFQAEEFVSRSDRPYLDMAEYYRDWRMTPIFEWCSRKQRIVVDYPQDDLVLIALRNNITGSYVEYADLVNVATFWKVPVVRQWMFPWGEMGETTTIENFVDGVSGEEGNEGYVVRFRDGHSLKVKSDWYVRIHRAKDSILQEKRVVEMILEEKVDDVLPHLIEADRKALSDFNDAFWSGFRRVADQLLFVLKSWHDLTGGSRKRFALEAQTDFNIKSVCFSLWDREHTLRTMHDEVMSRIRKSLSSNSKVDGARWMFGGVKWSDYLKAEDENGDTDR